MNVLRNLYARIVLRLIGPAIRLHGVRTRSQREKEVDETVFDALCTGRSMIRDGLEHVYGLKRSGR